MHDSVVSQRVPVAVFTCGAELKFKKNDGGRALGAFGELGLFCFSSFNLH